MSDDGLLKCSGHMLSRFAKTNLVEPRILLVRHVRHSTLTCWCHSYLPIIHGTCQRIYWRSHIFQEFAPVQASRVCGYYYRENASYLTWDNTDEGSGTCWGGTYSKVKGAAQLAFTLSSRKHFSGLDIRHDPLSRGLKYASTFPACTRQKQYGKTRCIKHREVTRTLFTQWRMVTGKIWTTCTPTSKNTERWKR